jgi:hypothetical protein
MKFAAKVSNFCQYFIIIDRNLKILAKVQSARRAQSIVARGKPACKAVRSPGTQCPFPSMRRVAVQRDDTLFRRYAARDTGDIPRPWAARSPNGLRSPTATMLCARWALFGALRCPWKMNYLRRPAGALHLCNNLNYTFKNL